MTATSQISSFVSDHTLLIGAVLLIGFCIWKFIIQPIENEGLPIDDKEETSSPKEDITNES